MAAPRKGDEEGGLYIRGTVVGRTRKLFDGGMTRDTCSIDTGEALVRLAALGEHGFMPLMERIDRKMEVRACLTKKGKAMYQIALALPGVVAPDEEAF